MNGYELRLHGGMKIDMNRLLDHHPTFDSSPIEGEEL